MKNKGLSIFIIVIFFNIPVLFSQQTLQDTKKSAEVEEALVLQNTLDLGLAPSGYNNSKVGTTISVLGDLNGDGYDDWAVHMLGPDYDSELGNGSVHLYYGSPNRRESETPADAVLRGDSTGHYGLFLNAAGDVNNDGFDDLISSTDKGFELNFGGDPINRENDIIFTKLDQHSGFMNFASSAGDVNNDGFDDILISLPTVVKSADTAYVYLFYGGENMDNIPDLIFTGKMNPPTDDYPGAQIFTGATGLGDVNKDGFDDIMISTSEGAKLYFGGADMNVEEDVLFEAFGDYGIGRGPDVKSAGDVNSDGYSDILIIGSLYYTKALIFYGGETVDDNPDVEIPIWTEKVYFGFSSIGAGDINKDGFDDILLGVNTNWSNEIGQARVFYGGTIMDSIADISLDGTEAYTSFGYSVAGGGDFDGDGYSDFLVGNNGNIASLNAMDDAGTISLFYGGESVDNTPNAVFSGVADNEGFGSSVANAGDVNNDGYMDLIVGAANHWENYYKGRAYLYFGGETFDKNPDLQFTTNENYNGERRFFGSKVGSLGDVNGDGFSDIFAEEVYKISIYLGGSAMDTISDYEIAVPKSNPALKAPYTLAPLGDVNNDGIDDVLYSDTKSGTGGTAMLYLGRENLLETPTLTFTGNTDDQLGYISGSAGDLNNDGYMDFFISVPGDDSFGSNSGSVYIYYGAKTISNSPTLVLHGHAGQEFGGKDVAGSGDVNGDGYSDIVVSDDIYSKTADSFEGCLYIYYGGIQMDTIVDVIITGDEAGIRLGKKVMFIPDLNNDGFDELLTNGANLPSGKESVSIFYGGDPIDSIPDIQLPYSTSYNDFNGYFDKRESVSYLLIGDQINNAAGPSSGRVFIYSNAEEEVITTNISTTTQTLQLKNYPNPFSQSTIISYQLPANAYVEISVYNIYGQKVRSLKSGHQSAGIHTERFDANGLTNGIYFYSIKFGNTVEVGKMLLTGY